MSVLPFPPPPALVLGALELLADVDRRGARHPASDDFSGDLERPWEPASCTGELGASIWGWCNDAAAWVNHEFAWRPAHMLPACWREHPHIARELPVLAVLRWRAETATAPEQVEEWNRYALPTFLDRMVDRLGESTCRTGRHQVWPAQSRYASFVADLAR